MPVKYEMPPVVNLKIGRPITAAYLLRPKIGFPLARCVTLFAQPQLIAMAFAVRPVSAEARELANKYESIRASVEFVREDSVFLVLRDSLGRYIDGLWTGANGPHWAVTL